MNRFDFDCPWRKNETVLNLEYKKAFQSRINCPLSQVNEVGRFPKSEQVRTDVGEGPPVVRQERIGAWAGSPIEQV